MIQENREILLQDLCSRLPYGVKCSFGVDDAIYEICGINPVCCGASEIQATHIKSGINGDFTINACKPYLFPLSSMTSKHRAELSMLVANEYDMLKSFLIEIEFYHKHHFDYRGLIEKGLAIDCTNLNIY